MSLASIKAKEATGKQKVLPKLKTILANPFQREPLLLNDLEHQCFGQLLRDAISESGSESQKFVVAKKICIGLESVIRAINNCQVSIVFLSQGIKPRFVLNLISRNVEIKNPAAPIYIVPQLEQFMEDIFGIQASAFSLPRAIENVSEGMVEWLSQRKKVLIEKQKTRVHLKQTKQKHRRVGKSIKGLNQSETSPRRDNVTSSWTGDYISLSSSSKGIEVNALNLEEDTTKLLNVLKQVTENVQNIKEQTTIIPDLKEDKTSNVELSDPEEDMDDFLPNYQPLQVNKICANPNKKHKKNRNKKFK